MAFPLRSTNPDPVTMKLEELRKGALKVRISKLAALVEGDRALQLHVINFNNLNISLAEGYRRDAPCRAGFNMPRKVSRHYVTSTYLPIEA